jgi:hypothetical protein
MIPVGGRDVAPGASTGEPIAEIRHDQVVMRSALHRLPVFAIAATSCLALAGCGLNIQSPDLFVLTRTGQGGTLRLLVNDDGTIKCNGGPAKTLADRTLIQARDLADNLDKDARSGLHIASGPNSVYSYRVELQHGTITFPDTAASAHHELAQAELFALQAAQGACAAPPG